jgi:dethiobiotin synthetase
MSYKNLYIAATSQHVGKTTSTLGLISGFHNKGINVGYCKPVGQKYVVHNNLQVDKDVVLFADLLNFTPNPVLHSPVILGSGTTTDFLKHPEKYHFEDRLKNAANDLNRLHDLIVYEGTGHPGVGSVVNLSNADVAKRINANVVMVAEGGVGSTIDMLNMCMSLFREKDVPVIGVILNKVLEDKREKCEYYVKKWLDKHDIPLLGILPYDKTMSLPLLKTVADSVNGTFEYNNEFQNNTVSDIIAGSLISADELKGKPAGSLLVVGAARLDIAIADTVRISKSFGLEKSPFAGIISTGHGSYSRQTIEYIQKHQIPVIRTMLETYGAVLKISRIEVKINQQTPWKVMRAIEMIEKNVDLDYILEKSKN